MSGPIGDAFCRPFIVAYATGGAPEEVARHRIEAEQFAAEWNAFMVHGPAVEAVPEDRIAPADFLSHTTVLFGSLDSSSLLRRADAVHELPVRIYNDGVTVRDPLHGDRCYAGEQFGAMLCYPNPLTDFRTYLVVVNRRLYMKPDGKQPQLLGYDLEKLPWAYPDYVVFNNDQSQLPHVLNVNNKPPVTCYEAAYFVEAGYFDDHWRVDRAGQLRRVRRRTPERHRFIHVAELSLDRAAHPPVARVRITGDAGRPVPTARVTGRWWGESEHVASASADEDGRVSFAAPPDASLDRWSFQVVNVMATGCTYDWTADVARTIAPGRYSPRQLELTLLTDRPRVAPEDAAVLRLAVHNNTPAPREVEVRLAAPSGRLIPERRSLRLAPSGFSVAEFQWRPGIRAPRPAMLRAEAVAVGGGSTAALSFPVEVLPSRGLPLSITDVKGTDIAWGEPWRVTAVVRSYGSEPIAATVHCAIVEARCFPTAKTVLVPAGGTVTVQWTGRDRLDKGRYTVRVSAAGAFGITGTGDFVVR